MASIDNKVVSITFDNRGFEKNVAQTIKTLAALKDSLDFQGAGSSLEEVSKAAGRFSLSGISDAVDNISSKFSVMGAVGFTVIQNLTNSAIGMAKNVAALIIDPMMNGGRQRAENIEQAKFLFRGLEMDIDASMESARLAVTGTAFGLDAAAKAAAQLGGSGLRAGEEMTGALRGIAGIAAMTNSSYEEMSSIFITAAGKGKVMSNELERISHRGVNAAAALAKEWGITELEVREMASTGQISFQMFAEAMDGAFGEHATKANETYSGSLANMRAALARIGANIHTDRLVHMRDVFNSLTPAIDKINKALKPVFAALSRIRGLTLRAFINYVDAIDFSTAERSATNLSWAMLNLFEAVKGVFNSLRGAFSEVFPPSSTGIILKISQALAKFSRQLVMSQSTLSKVTSIFKGFFSIIKIGMAIVKGVFSVFKTLFGLFSGGGSGTILTFFAKLGDGINALRVALVDGGGIANAFDKINSALTSFVGKINFGAAIDAVRDFIRSLDFRPAFKRVKDAFALLDFGPLLKVINNVKDAVGGFFSGLFGGGDSPEKATEKANKGLNVFASILIGLGKVAEFVGNAFASLFSGIGKIGSIAVDVGSKVGEVVAAVWDAITSALSSGSPIKMDDFLKVLGGGVLAVIAKAIYNFSKNGLKLNVGQFDFLHELGQTLDSVRGVLKAIQVDIVASALLKIAVAIGVLTLSLIALSFVDGLSLAKSMAAVASGLGLLVGAMAGLDKIASGEASAGKIAILAISMFAIGGAMLLLAMAAKLMATSDPVALTVGLLGMLGALESIGRVMERLTKNTDGMVKAAFAIGVLSLSLLIMAAAVRAWMALDMLDMAVAIFAISAALTVISETMGKMPADGMVKAAFSIGILSLSLIVLGFAIKQMSNIGLVETATGLITLGVALSILSKFLKAIAGPDVLKAGFAMLLMSVGVGRLAAGIKSLGEIDLPTLGKGLGALAVILRVLAKSLDATKQSMGGAVALMLTAGAIIMLANAVEQMGRLPFMVLVQGLLGVLAAIGAFALITSIISPLIPLITALGLSLGAVGLAALAFGAGVYFLARGVGILAKVGPDGVVVFLKSLDDLLIALPKIAIALGKAAFMFVTSFLSGFDELIPLVVKLLGLLLDAIIELVPKLVETAGVVILAFLDYITTMYPAIVQAGWDLLLAFLGGIRDNIGELASTAIGILTEFIDAMAEGIPDYVRSMVNLFTTVLTTMAYELGLLITTLAPDMGMALIDGILTGLDQTGGKIIEFFTEWVGKVIDWVKSLFGIKSPSTEFLSIGVDLIMGLLNGITDTIGQVMSFFTGLLGDVLGWIGDALGALVSKGADLITGIWNGIDSIIGTVSGFFEGLIESVKGWIGRTLSSLFSKGYDLMTGLWNGIKAIRDTVFRFFNNLGSTIKGYFFGAIDWLYDIGKAIIQGLWDGMRWLWDNGPVGWVRGLGGWIAENKGPMSYDKVLLFDNGAAIMQGLYNGMQDGWRDGARWVEGLGASIVDGFQVDEKELTNPIRDAISSMINTMDGLEDLDGPVITPVLDLTQVRQDAKQLGGIFDTRTGLQSALAISSATNANREEALVAAGGPTEIKYEQNIHAPTALSTNDIYRQTRSLIAITKEEAKIP